MQKSLICNFFFLVLLLCLVVLLCQTLCSPWTVAQQALLSIGILQARILEQVALPTFRGSSQPRDQTQVSHITGIFSTIWVTRKWKWSGSVVSDSLRPHGLQPTRLLHPWDFPGRSTGVGCHSHQGSPYFTMVMYMLDDLRIALLLLDCSSFVSASPPFPN